jgi:hypothetical protein
MGPAVGDKISDGHRGQLVEKPDHRLKDAGEVAKAVTRYLADAEERAQKAKLAQAVAEEKAERARETGEAERRVREQADKARRLAEEKAEVERQKAEAERQARKLAEKARWRMLWGSACAALFLVALTGAGFFAWRHSEARPKILADTLDRSLTAAMSADRSVDSGSETSRRFARTATHAARPDRPALRPEPGCDTAPG